MTVKEFWESKSKLAIHCNTKEKANRLLDKFNELGKAWCTGESYVLDNTYNVHGSSTCYSNQGTYGSVYAFANECTLIQFNDIDDFKQEKQKKDTMKEETKIERKFKIGDKVRVRKDLELLIPKNKESGDDAIYAIHDKLKYKGLEGTIEHLGPQGCYKLKENCFWWSDKLLEPVSKSAVLDDVEFDYIWGIIKPFKSEIRYIKKDFTCFGYFIRIGVGPQNICLPSFSLDSEMYKGMEEGKNYTLEELGFVKSKPKLNCKVVCIESDFEGFTVGRIYNFKDGCIRFNFGYSAFAFDSVEEFNIAHPGWKLLEIIE